MIPKILHFIWFGRDMPNYAQHVMNTYKQINPDFQINFIYEKDIKNAINQDVKACYRLISDKKTKYYKIFNAKHFKNTQNRSKLIFNTAFSDAFRFYLLDQYGGIYLDIDTWPVKPFDQALMELDYFYVQWKWAKKLGPDVFFMGADGKVDIAPPSFNFPAKPTLLSANYTFFNEAKGIKLAEKLKNGTIKYGDSYYSGKDIYINHLNKKTSNWYTEMNKVLKNH